MAARLENTVSRLLQEKEFLKNMISNISHQLKTPLPSFLLSSWHLKHRHFKEWP